jgi:hypothetical protein
MYAFVLIAHSWLRYVVLALGIVVLVTAIRGLSAPAVRSAGEERAYKAFLGALDTQLVLGLLLYFVWNPIVASALADFGAAMKNPQLRFFAVEHAVTMLLAIVIAHVGRARSRRKEGRARYRSVLIAQALWLLLTLAAIPWPVLDVGRPLLRF